MVYIPWEGRRLKSRPLPNFERPRYYEAFLFQPLCSGGGMQDKGHYALFLCEHK